MYLGQTFWPRFNNLEVETFLVYFGKDYDKVRFSNKSDIVDDSTNILLEIFRASSVFHYSADYYGLVHTRDRPKGESPRVVPLWVGILEKCVTLEISKNSTYTLIFEKNRYLIYNHAVSWIKLFKIHQNGYIRTKNANFSKFWAPVEPRKASH